MEKIRILGPTSLLPDVIARLQDIGAIHIDPAPPDLGRIQPDIPLIHRHALDPAAQHARASLESMLESVRKLLIVLPDHPGAPGPPGGAAPGPSPALSGEASLKALNAQLSSLAARVGEIVDALSRSRDELSLFSRYDRVLKVLAPLIGAVHESRGLECTGLVIPAREAGTAPMLEEAFSRLTGGRYEIIYREVDKETLAGLLIFPKEQAAEARSLLWEKRIGELRLPASVADKPLPEAFEAIARAQAEHPEAIRRLEGELLEISRRWRGTLLDLRRQLENRVRRILVSVSFYESRKTFLLFGWIPRDEFGRLETSLAAAFGGVVIAERLPVARADAELAPVLLRNRAAVRPFEIFTRVLPLPRYGTIDPTPLVAFFFPLFYGIIIGDLGYGLLLLAIAVLVRWRYRDEPFLADAATVFSWSALSAAAWGVAYGEFFGDLGTPFGMRPLLFHRMGDFRTGLLFALGIGVVHVLLGIGLGIRTAWRRGRPREAIAKTAGLVLVLAALATIAGASGAAPPAATRVGAAALLASVAAMLLAGGAAAAMELHNLVNVLSYLRIMGIGVASVALAYAANRIASVAAVPVLGIAAGLLLHAVNLGFCVLSPTIQALRLHYVEFFENFFHGGGRAYKPFRMAA